MSGHIFVDESKQRDNVLVAAVVMPGVLVSARRELRTLVIPGQRRLHMKKERDARRRAIVDAIASIGATATSYNAGRPGRHELDACEVCLPAGVEVACALRCRTSGGDAPSRSACVIAAAVPLVGGGPQPGVGLGELVPTGVGSSCRRAVGGVEHVSVEALDVVLDRSDLPGSERVPRVVARGDRSQSR